MKILTVGVLIGIGIAYCFFNAASMPPLTDMV